MHVVARCNNREFYFTAAEDFEILLDHLEEMSSACEVRLFAYTLMSSHIHLLLQAPAADVLGRPLRCGGFGDVHGIITLFLSTI